MALIIRTHINGSLLFQDEQGESWLATKKDFYKDYANRELYVDLDQPFLGETPTVVCASADLTCYEEHHQAEALRRRAYIDGVVNADGSLPRKKEIPARIEATGKYINDEKRFPSLSSVCRWFAEFRVSKSIISLIPTHYNKGRHKTIVGEVEDLLLDVLAREYFVENRPTIKHAYKCFTTEMGQINSELPPSQKMATPSRASVYRYIDTLDPRQSEEERYGEHATKKKFRHALHTVEAEHILDRWEVDHTTLDVLLVDEETGAVIGRPYLTVVIDRASRMLMAYLLHLSAPDTESVLRVIERAIKPKAAWLEKFPGAINAWDARGLPRRIVPDNATEFHAKNLLVAFNDIGVELLFPPSRAPEYKGCVERFFRTLNGSLIHRLPGTTFSNTRDRGDYPAEERACLTFSELEKMLVKWIVDVYHQTTHRGLAGKTPAEIWKKMEPQRPIHLPADLDNLSAILAARDECPIHHYGVETGCVRYNSSELQEIRQRAGAPETVEVRYRDELDHVWVRDKENRRFIKVPAIDKRMIGLSRDIYQAARKMVRDAKNDTNSPDATFGAYRARPNGLQCCAGHKS